MKNKVLYSSQYIPPEWIKIHGFQPVNMISQNNNAFQESSEGVCPYAELMFKQAELFDGSAVVFTTRCDQMRRISELYSSSGAKLFLMNIPATWQNQTAIGIYKDELKRLSSFLIQTGGTEPDFENLVTLFKNKKRPDPPKVGNEKRIALMGGPAIDFDSGLINLIQEHSAKICLDATEIGELAIPDVNLKKLADDPYSELAIAYFANMPDIAKRPNKQFYEHIDEMVKQRNIDAIIVRTYPWCDIWHAEIPRIKELFKLPLLHFTADVCTSPKNDSRLKTRLKAFFEIL